MGSGFGKVFLLEPSDNLRELGFAGRDGLRSAGEGGHPRVLHHVDEAPGYPELTQRTQQGKVEVGRKRGCHVSGVVLCVWRVSGSWFASG
jgi:hypothetical protein